MSPETKIEDKKHQELSGKSFFFEMLETLVSSVIVILVIYSTIAFPELVVGSSMEPNFYTGERILVEKVTKYFSPYKRGDIVVLHPPGNDNIDYIKRISKVCELQGLHKVRRRKLFIRGELLTRWHLHDGWVKD